MELFKVGDFRVAQITRITAVTPDGYLVTEVMSIREGVGIEKANPDGKSWYVIAFLKPDENEVDIKIEPVGFRMIEAASDDVEAFQDVFFEGRRILIEALAAEDEEWKEFYEYAYPQD